MAVNRYIAIIVDDEPSCIDNLSNSLQGYPEMVVAGEARTPDQGMELVIRKRPDLLFLDVELPGMSGLEMLRQLQPRIDWPMKVVFYTSHQKYWLEALRESAFDYLLKPYTEEDFSVVMTRFFEQNRQVLLRQPFERMLSELLPSHQTFMVADVIGYRMVRVGEVGYFYYSNERRQWMAVSSDGKNIPLGRNVKSDRILSFSSQFVQISRDRIVNINYVCSIDSRACRLIPPFEKVEGLEISRKYFSAVQESFRLL